MLGGGDLDPTVGTDRINGVEHEIRDDLLQLIFVREDRLDSAQVGRDGNLDLLVGGEEVPDAIVEIDRSALQFKFLPK